MFQLQAKKIFFNASSYAFSQVIPGLSFLFLLPIYAQVLSPEEFGVIALLTGFTSFLSPIITFQLGSSIVRYYFQYSGNEFKVFYSTTIYFSIIISLILLLAVHLLGQGIISTIYPNTMIPYYPIFYYGIIYIYN